MARSALSMRSARSAGPWASDLPLLFDSGIRTGADVFKALALGARRGVPRPPLHVGSGSGRPRGREQVLRCLLAELDLTLALSGYTSIAQLDDSSLIRSS